MFVNYLKDAKTLIKQYDFEGKLDYIFISDNQLLNKFESSFIDKEIYKPMLCLMNILSSFSAVYELLADVTITPRSNYGTRDMPKGLIVNLGYFFIKIIYV